MGVEVMVEILIAILMILIPEQKIMSVFGQAERMGAVHLSI